MKDRLFIALEGIDGSGKSTQAGLLARRLELAGQRVYSTVEPTTGPIGALIRDAFNHRLEADHRTIAGLFVADRLDHLLNRRNGILKMLEEGYTVVTDRYYFSSYAYQGTHMPMEWVIRANELSASLRRPDLNIFIDMDPEVCMERLHKSRSSMELYETLENLKMVREKYFEAFDLLGEEEKILIIDGNRPPEPIATEILHHLRHLP